MLVPEYHPASPRPTRLDPYRTQLNDLSALVLAAMANAAPPG